MANNRVLIYNNGEYIKYISTWQRVTSTIPTELDYINGNTIDEVMTIPETAWSQLKGNVELHYYTDNISTKDVKFNIETEPFTFYDVLGNSVDVQYYTDDSTIQNPNLNMTYNYSPLDDLRGDIELVTYTDSTSVTDFKVNVSALPIGQIVVENKDLQLYGDLSQLVLNRMDDTLVKGNLKTVISFDEGNTWWTFNNQTWEQVDVTSELDVNTKGMTLSKLSKITPNDFSTKISSDKKLRFAYYIDEMPNNKASSKIKSIETVQNATISTPVVNNMSLYILNTVSTIDLSLIGNVIDGSIKDIDHGKIRYRVLLNNTPYYPIDGNFTTFESTPLNISIRINSDKILMDKQNTLRIEIEDYWGEKDYKEIQFVGSYSGLLFKDSSGEYYSNDIGKVLKYMDIGTLIAGQVSQEFEVRLFNTYGYDVENVVLTPNTESSGVTIELSKSNQPFVAESPFTWDLLKNNEGAIFYVRLVTNYGTPPSPNGTFELRVDADPVDESI